MSDRAIVLLSGGIDSATAMAIACNTHESVRPIHVRYGQQTAELERQMAINQRNHLSREYEGCHVGVLDVIDYSDVFEYFAAGVANPDKTFEGGTEDDGRSVGYVPMRNLHLIATAAAIADVDGAEYVYHGAQGGDEADYPDCRPVFMSSAERAISFSVPDSQRLELQTPLLSFSKPEVIQVAEKLGVEFQYTYSCYKATSIRNPSPCGECPACEERISAFEEAEVEDPYMPEVA